MVKAVVSIALVGWLAAMLDWARIGALPGIAWLIVPCGAAITLVALAAMTARWRRLIELQGAVPLSMASGYRGYRIGAFFNIFLPGAIGGDLIRIKYAADESGLPLADSTLVVATERLFGLTALILVFLVALPLNADLLPMLDLQVWVAVTVAMVAGVALVATMLLISRRITLPLRAFPALIGLSAAAQLGDVAIVAGALPVMGHAVPVTALLFVMPLVYVATVLPISLGGLGVREGVLSGLLMLFGVPQGDAILTAFLLYLAKVLTGLTGVPAVMARRAVQERS